MQLSSWVQHKKHMPVRMQANTPYKTDKLRNILALNTVYYVWFWFDVLCTKVLFSHPKLPKLSFTTMVVASWFLQCPSLKTSCHHWRSLGNTHVKTNTLVSYGVNWWHVCKVLRYKILSSSLISWNRQSVGQTNNSLRKTRIAQLGKNGNPIGHKRVATFICHHSL